MGNRSTNSNPKLGSPGICPNCERTFPSSTTYATLHAHIDHCLVNQNQNQNQIY